MPGKVGMIGPSAAGGTPPPPPATDPWPTGGSPSIPDNAGQTINQMIAAASEGATINVPGNKVYRETVNINKGVTLVAGTGAEIRASERITAWTDLGNGTWRSNVSIPALTTESRWQFEPITNLTAAAPVGDTVLNVASTANITVGKTYMVGRGKDTCTPNALYNARQVISKTATTVTLNSGLSNAFDGSGNCVASLCHSEGFFPEMVFVDGQKVLFPTVGSVTNADTFALDASRRVIIGFNPASYYIEATWRNNGVTISGTGGAATLDGFAIHHAGAANIQRNSARVLTIIRCESKWAHTRGYSGGQTTLTLEDSRFWLAGQMGISNSSCPNLTMRGCKCDQNNFKLFRVGWEAGGAKLSGHDVALVTDNIFEYNRGEGLWYDIISGGQDIETSYNLCRHNDSAGIRNEVTLGLIHHNICYNNENNIQISGSHNVTVEDNICAWASNREIQIDQQHRSSRGAEQIPYDRVYNIFVRRNDMIHQETTSSQRYGICWFKNDAAIAAGAASIYDDIGNDGTNNRFAFTNASGAYDAEPGSQPRYKWVGTYSTLAAMQAAGQETGSTNITSQATIESILTAAGIPLTPTG
jgi:hypothetical protein